MKIFTVLNIFLSFRIFEQLALDLKFFEIGGQPPSRLVHLCLGPIL